MEAWFGDELIYNCDRIILFLGTGPGFKHGRAQKTISLKKDEAQIMVLFCLNQIGNHILSPFNHLAVSLPHSISKGLISSGGFKKASMMVFISGNGCILSVRPWTGNVCKLRLSHAGHPSLRPWVGVRLMFSCWD